MARTEQSRSGAEGRVRGSRSRAAGIGQAEEESACEPRREHVATPMSGTLASP